VKGPTGPLDRRGGGIRRATSRIDQVQQRPHGARPYDHLSVRAATGGHQVHPTDRGGPVGLGWRLRAVDDSDDRLTQRALCRESATSLQSGLTGYFASTPDGATGTSYAPS